MAAKDLITLARAKQSILSITDSSQDTLLGVLLTAASDAIEKYCRRSFYARSLDELYNGSGDGRLLLREYPIQSIQSVRHRPTTVLKVQNTSASNQRATVAVASTGLRLTRVASGTSSTDTSVTWAANATLNAVKNAVNALGNGWSAQVTGDAAGDYGLWPSADLYAAPAFGDGTQAQGALNARGTWVELKLHVAELADFGWDARGWLLRSVPGGEPEWLSCDDLVWPVGVNNFRVQYTAGYTTIPEAVQEACALVVAAWYWLANRDPEASSLGVPEAGSYAFAIESWPARVLGLLAPYRRHTVAISGG